MGDLLVSGPAIRAVAHGSQHLALLTSPGSAEVAQLLPGVDQILSWSCPWIAADPPPVSREETDALLADLRAARFDEAVVLTSFHQSSLPTALLLRLAGVRRIAAVSEDYPGSLLDIRISPPGDAPEPERMLSIARAAGYELPAGDDGALRVALPRLGTGDDAKRPYVVAHPGASAEARQYPERQWRSVVAGLTSRGWQVMVTGSDDERDLTAAVAGGAAASGAAHDLGGLLDIGQLGHLLRRASAVVVGNTGPAHLAAAVGAPVVSLFSPVVSLERWAPYTDRRIVLGDQQAPCRGSRATVCVVPEHPCLTTVSPDAVIDAVTTLTLQTSDPCVGEVRRQT
jgi:ADP-heptose:LPS heptosyltransferase